MLTERMLWIRAVSRSMWQGISFTIFISSAIARIDGMFASLVPSVDVRRLKPEVIANCEFSRLRPNGADEEFREVNTLSARANFSTAAVGFARWVYIERYRLGIFLGYKC